MTLYWRLSQALCCTLKNVNQSTNNKNCRYKSITYMFIAASRGDTGKF